MNLASKLDRLRGAAAGGDTERAGPRVAPVPPGRPGSASRRSLLAGLAAALGAESATGDLLLRRCYHALPAVADDPRGLSHLPEVYGQSSPDWVYIDTETTGLSGGSGNLAFMVGAARYSGPGVLEVRQYVLGSFAAESRMLRELLDWVGPDAVLVSYNGRCFDLPLLATRLGMHRIDAAPGALPHLDLMYSVRRAYRGHWPDCRLQTAERRLLDLHRIDDLPGSDAPAAWQSWLRDGATSALTRVLAHNFQDVVSLALLHRRMLPDYAGSGRPGLNHAAIGMAWLRAGQAAQARRVWEKAGCLLDEHGGLELAALYRRLGEWSLAEAMWLRLYARGSQPAALALSKYYEHHKRDFGRAIDFAACCHSAERGPRSARLRHKMGDNLELPFPTGAELVSPRR